MPARGEGTSTHRLVAWLLAAGLVWLLLAHPAFYSRTRAYGLLVMALGLVWLALLVGQRQRWREFVLPRAPTEAIGAILISAVLSLLANSAGSGFGLWLLASQLLFLWLGWWLGAVPEELVVPGISLLGTAALAGLYGVIQYYGLDPLPVSTSFGRDRVVSFFANPNDLGSFLACALPLALAVLLSAISARPAGRWSPSRMGAYALVVLIYGGLLLAACRGAWGGGLAGCLIVSIGYIRQIVRGRAGWRPGSLLALVLLLAGVTFLLAQRPVIRGTQGEVSLVERALSSAHLIRPYEELEAGAVAEGERFRVRDVSIDHRHFIWRVTWRMISAHPLLGIGYGNYRDRFVAFREAVLGEERFQTLNPVAREEAVWHAHDEYLHFWAEGGIVGLGGFLGLVILSLRQGTRRVWQGQGKALYLWGVLGGVAAMLVHSLVSYPLRLPLSGMFFWMSLGLLLRRDSPSIHGDS